MSTTNRRPAYNGSDKGTSGQRILYDARGTRVKSSPLNNKLVRFLLFFLLPYIVINGIILVLVCATPDITINVKDTDNYADTEVTFTVNSLLPLKELTVNMESAPIEYEKSGKNYKCTVNKNGTLFVDATCINGMHKTAYTDISTLDNTPPSVDESTVSFDNEILSLKINDTQSGVNFDTVYAVVNDTDTITPSSVDRTGGTVCFPLASENEVVEVFFEDMVGNKRSAQITVTFSGADPSVSQEGGEAGAGEVGETGAGEGAEAASEAAGETKAS